MNVGIVGIGKLGSIHLRIYSEINGIGKIYPVDIDEAKLCEHKHSTCFTRYQDLKGKVDLVSIATPTLTHFEIASFFLTNRIPVLVEKPITQDLRQANRLIKIAKKNRTLIFVGHVERYNSAYLAAKKVIHQPLFVECHRLSPYPARSIDISVVLDLMIHDLDILLDLVKDKIKRVEAKGVKVISPTEDIANVRLTFKKGCVANITASRISSKKERKIRIFMPNSYISLDYAQQNAEIYQKIGNEIKKEALTIDKAEPLKQEINEFVGLVQKNEFKIEYAVGARQALQLALHIQRLL